MLSRDEVKRRRKWIEETTATFPDSSYHLCAEAEALQTAEALYERVEELKEALGQVANLRNPVLSSEAYELVDQARSVADQALAQEAGDD